MCSCVCHAAGDGCGPTVLGPTSGTLSSLGYPWMYPNNSVCEWEITVPRGNRLHFRFAELDIEDRDCQVNYLRLFNGIGPGRMEKGERSGQLFRKLSSSNNSGRCIKLALRGL